MTYATILAAVEERAAAAADSGEYDDERRLCLELRNVAGLLRAGELIERHLADNDLAVAANLQHFARLPPPCQMWAPVILGYRVTQKSWPHVASVEDLFTGIDTAVRQKTIWPFHLGVALAIADAVCQSISETSSAACLTAAIARFASLCDKSAVLPCTSTALDALGFTTAGKPAELAERIGELVTASNPDLEAPYWHGVGRARYFEFAPRLDVRRAGGNLERVVQGLAWQATITNVNDPCVVARYANLVTPAIEECTAAFVTGVCCALDVWTQSVPSDDAAARFAAYEPTTAERPVWRRIAHTASVRRPEGAYASDESVSV